MTSITQVATDVNHTLTTRELFNTPRYHLKGWDDLEKLKTDTGIATCAKVSDSGKVTTIAGKNGTYNKPGSIYLLFPIIDKIPKSAKITKLTLHYANQVLNAQNKTTGSLPAFAGPKIRLYSSKEYKGEKRFAQKTGVAPTSTYTYHTMEFTNFETSDVSDKEFGIVIDFPKNTSENTGRLLLGNIYLEAEVDLKDIVVSITASNEKVNKNTTFNVDFKAKRTDNVDEKVSLEISTSKGLNYMSKVSGTGAITPQTSTTTENIVYWDSNVNSKYEATCTLSFKPTVTGRQTITLTDRETKTAQTITITVKESQVTITPNVVIQDGDSRVLTVGKSCQYNITATSTDPDITEIAFVIVLPACAEIENQTALQTYFSGTITTTDTEKRIGLRLTKENGIFPEVPMIITFNDSGIYVQQIIYQSAMIASTTFTVKPAEYKTLAYTKYRVPDYVHDAMGKNLTYYAICRMKYTINSQGTYKIMDHKINIRFGVFCDSAEYVNDHDEFIKHTQFYSKMVSDKFQNYRVSFKNNDDYPVYLVWAHDYMEGELFDILSLEFYEPMLIEPGLWQGRMIKPARYTQPINNLLYNADNEYASVKLYAVDNKTNPVILSQWNDGGILNLSDVAVQGIQVHWDYVVDNDVEVILELFTIKNGIVKKGRRSVSLQDTDGKEKSIGIGDEWDTFQLKPKDLRDITSMWLQFKLENLRSDGTVKVDFQNFQIRMHYLVMDTQTFGFTIEGERSEEYGVFLEDDFQWDFGTENKVQYYQTEGTDETTAYRMNIEKKELKFKISLYDCDLPDASTLLEKVTKLFTNKRDIYNKPIPKWIIFDHIPNYKFYFVREKAFDTKLEYGNYTCTVTLTIPSGTAIEATKTITGDIGRNNGLARVTPFIRVRATATKTVKLVEKNTSQYVYITNDKIKVGDLLTINSESRRVFYYPKGDTKGTNITSSVDWSSTWFKIDDEYEFQSSTCDVISVEFNERW